MNSHRFSHLNSLQPDFSKLINKRPSKCPSCGSEVSLNDIIEARGNVGCTICLR